ncbi:hypothetical protein HID58_069106 [Brassica napus]|uniref:Uncharacterized protein n=2 Tax=Brassica TaxID=3705 RepID=A0ABQ7ZN87_BRANA|nr:PREDICTED: uncharacterized protein C9orf85 homolog [Brassica oleracea var. oleracea]XP_048614287.1 uncharacterized protein C9orf85 homolog [Brassica napus]KAH0881712.1 hypothetical protein HID58_069106 [Brassica napus]
MGSRQGPPKHQNKFAWVPNAGVKINETEVGGRFRPLSEITGVCHRCREQIAWKRKYGKYKKLTEPAKCQKCLKRNVRQAYHKLCTGCAKEQKVCAKCYSSSEQIMGRDIYEVEAEQKLLDETIKNARERDRRTLLRAMNKDSNPKKSDEEATRSDSSKVGDVFPSTSLEEYANKSGRVSGIIGHGHVVDDEDEDEDDVASEPELDEDHSGDDDEHEEVQK